MATYTVTNKYLIYDFAVLQLLTPSEIAVGQSITVAGVDAAIFDGTYCGSRPATVFVHWC
jgi:hypothetical protein